jgi:hypothetical protein
VRNLRDLRFHRSTASSANATRSEAIRRRAGFGAASIRVQEASARTIPLGIASCRGVRHLGLAAAAAVPSRLKARANGQA